MFNTKQTLIVVYKDELLMNQLRKLIETQDDKDGEVIGTRDNSINVVSWNEKVWLGNKKAGNIQGKILFLGDIKGTDKLVPVLDVKFDEFGVKYGWAGNQAVLYIEPKALMERKNYDEFVKKLSEMAVPEFLKSEKNIESGLESDSNRETTEDDIEEIAVDAEKKKKHKAPQLFKAVHKIVETGADAVGKVGNQVVTKSEEMFRNKSLMKRQMLFYGVIHLYNDGLEEFMNM